MRIRDQEIPITNTFKNKIIHQYDTEYIFNDVIPYYFDDIDVFNLFMKDSEKEPKYTGKMVDCEVGIECVSVEYEGKTYKGRDIVMNYVKNVGGKIRELKTEKFRNSTSQTFYITIAKDVPYCSNLQETFDAFAQQEHRLIARHYLRHLENKNLPEKRNERRYLGIYLREKPTEIELSFFTAAILAILSILIY